MYRRNIKFWGQDINVFITKTAEKFSVDNLEMTLPKENAGMVYTLQGADDESVKKFIIAFNQDMVKGSVIAHEVWHLFFAVLCYVSGGDVELWAKELSREIYAYQFGELFRMVNNFVCKEIAKKCVKKK